MQARGWLPRRAGRPCARSGRSVLLAEPVSCAPRPPSGPAGSVVAAVASPQQEALPAASPSRMVQPAEPEQLGRRRLLAEASLLCMAGAACMQPAAQAEEASSSSAPDTSITHKVYLDIAIAPRSFKTPNERTLGDTTVLPLEDAAPVGRLVLGLYGNVAPGTVANFLRVVKSGALRETTFSRVLPGEYIQAGQQGAHRLGGVEAQGADLQQNPDLFSSQAFKLTHLRPGTVSLSLSESDEDAAVQGRPGFHSVEFLITTGPGPVPRLDGQNLVFGRVLEGLSVVNTIAQVPTFKPSERSKQLNVFAEAIGDDRALSVRRKYGKPLKAVIITDAGVL